MSCLHRRDTKPIRVLEKRVIMKVSNRRKLHETFYGWIFAAPFAVLFTLCTIVPIIASLIKSTLAKRLSMGGFGPMEDVFVGMSNYLDVLRDLDLWHGMLNVVEYGAVKIPAVIGFALVLALILDSIAARAVSFFRLSYFLPYAIPGVVGAILWSYLYSPNLSPFTEFLGFIGLSESAFINESILNVSMANMTLWTMTGYNMIIFMATLKSIPNEIYEAARIDGATEMQIAWKIKIPQLRNAALLTVLMSIIGTVQYFNEPTVLRTLVPRIDSHFTPMMMAYNQAFGANNQGAAAAISVVMAIIAGILAAIYAYAQIRLGSTKSND